MRVVDEALPPRRRPRLLEVDAHRDEDVVRDLRGFRGETVRIVLGRFGIVDAAGTDDREHAIVPAIEDRRDLFAALDDEFGARGRQGKTAKEVRWPVQRLYLLDPAVADSVPLCRHLGAHRAACASLPATSAICLTCSA